MKGKIKKIIFKNSDGRVVGMIPYKRDPETDMREYKDVEFVYERFETDVMGTYASYVSGSFNCFIDGLYASVKRGNYNGKKAKQLRKLLLRMSAWNDRLDELKAEEDTDEN